MLQGDVVAGAAIGVVDRDHRMITLSQRQGVIRLRRSAGHQISPALHGVAVGSHLHDVEADILSDVVQVDRIGPAGAAVD